MLVLVVRDICLISTQVIIEPFVFNSYGSPPAPSSSCFHPSAGQKVNYLKQNLSHGESQTGRHPGIKECPSRHQTVGDSCYTIQNSDLT